MENKILMTARGQWVPQLERYDVNLSSVYTFLIKEAAKCEKYSSDILIDIEVINKELKVKKEETVSRLFGFRDFGVDHRAFVEVRGITSEEYFSVYELVIKFNAEEVVFELSCLKGGAE